MCDLCICVTFCVRGFTSTSDKRWFSGTATHDVVQKVVRTKSVWTPVWTTFRQRTVHLDHDRSKMDHARSKWTTRGPNRVQMDRAWSKMWSKRSPNGLRFGPRVSNIFQILTDSRSKNMGRVEQYRLHRYWFHRIVWLKLCEICNLQIASVLVALIVSHVCFTITGTET